MRNQPDVQPLKQKALLVETLCPKCRNSFYYEANAHEVWVVGQLLKDCSDHKNQERRTAVRAWLMNNSCDIDISRQMKK